MAGTAFSFPVGGFWPFGKITVTTNGTPVAINTNVGAQGQGGQFPTQMARRIRQLLIYPLSTNTKPVYVVMKGYSHTVTNGVLCIVYPGAVGSLPQGALLDGAMPTIDSFYLDSEVNGEGAFCVGIYG